MGGERGWGQEHNMHAIVLKDGQGGNVGEWGSVHLLG